MADKKPAEKKNLKGIWNLYEIKGEELVRKNKWSPKLGPGFFMASHKNRWTCGQSGYTEFKKIEKKE